MREHKLFNIRIQPKDGDGDVFEFKFVVENASEALIKMMALPDIDYMYDPVRDEIIITYEGVVY